MNKVPTPNMASILATYWFTETLQAEVERQHLTKKALARVANVRRKTIYEWMEGIRSPKLENVAQLFAALGYKSITIPLSQEVTDDNLL